MNVFAQISSPNSLYLQRDTGYEDSEVMWRNCVGAAGAAAGAMQSCAVPKRDALYEARLLFGQANVQLVLRIGVRRDLPSQATRANQVKSWLGLPCSCAATDKVGTTARTDRYR